MKQKCLGSMRNHNAGVYLKKKKRQSKNKYVPCSGYIQATLRKLTTELWLRSLRTDCIKLYCKRQTVLYGLHEVENN